MRTKLFSFSFVILLLVGLCFTVNASTPTDRSVDAAYGVVYENECLVDTIKSATDSAVLKSEWVIPANQLGCLFVLSMPAITGTGSDSVKAYLAVKGYDKYGNYMFTYNTTDTSAASTAKRIVLPIETPLCVASKYTILFYGYTASGTQEIFPNTKIYAEKLFNRQN